MVSHQAIFVFLAISLPITGDDDNSSLPDHLWEAISKSLYGPPNDASINIKAPHPGDVLIYSNDPPYTLDMRVSSHGFTMLEEGHWCVLANGHGVMCVGDRGVEQIQVDLTEPILHAINGSNPTITPSSSSPVKVTITLEAVLAGGSLEHPSVLRWSPPVPLQVLVGS